MQDKRTKAELAGKAAIVTGSTSGVGLGIASAFAEAGMHVMLNGFGDRADWIIGTSIGAINASLIAGNEPENRLPRLKEFWDRMAYKSIWHASSAWPQLSQSLSCWNTIARGIPGFFEPNPMAFWGSHLVLGADRAGYYSTEPLEKTLDELVDFSLVNRCKPRLTVGAAHVRTSQMKYFDSRDTGDRPMRENANSVGSPQQGNPRGRKRLERQLGNAAGVRTSSARASRTGPWRPARHRPGTRRRRAEPYGSRRRAARA